jgi:histidine triad (HIT) family protein
MSESIFTKICKREIPSSIIYEDENHLAFLDIFPFEKGHTLVIPKKEYETIFDMPEEEFKELMGVVHKVAKHIEEVLDCGVNICQNNKKSAHQEVMHVHFHVIPRREEKALYRMENKDKYLGNEEEIYRKKLVIKNG